MVRQRDPNDDYAVIGDAQWRDYAGIGYDDGSANAPAYFSADQIGTTRRIADSAGCDNAPPNCSPAILHRKISTAFGEPVSTASATGFDHPRYGYEKARSGDPLALLGWLHVGERYYAPELGRFVQRDPIGIRGGLNVYGYASNNPVTGFDPSGLRDDAAWESYYRRRDDLRQSESQEPPYPGPIDIANDVANRYTGKKTDKWMHFVVSCRVTAELPGGFLYIIPGSFAKEVHDLIGGADWIDSFGDMLCNLAGFGLGPSAAIGACDCEQEANRLGL